METLRAGTNDADSFGIACLNSRFADEQRDATCLRRGPLKAAML
jgi:hypothetical protein